MKVFVVEDSEELRTRLEALVAAIPGGATVGHADGVQRAIEGIRASEPDAVILDLKLVDGSGIDVLKALHKAASKVAVYVLSNFSAEPYRRLAERFGARGFFDKTHEFDLLRAALSAHARQP